MDLLLEPIVQEHRISKWVLAHQRELIFVFVGGILLLGALAGWSTWQQSNGNKAEVALYEAEGKRDALEKVIQKYPHSSAALLALVNLGSLARDENNFDDCIKNFGKAYEKAGHEAFFRVLSLEQMGTCYRAKGDFKKGAELFDRAAKEPGNLAPAVSRFEAIRCHQFEKDPQTESLYQSFLAEKNLPPEIKDKVKEQLLWLHPKKS